MGLLDHKLTHLFVMDQIFLRFPAILTFSVTQNPRSQFGKKFLFARKRRKRMNDGEGRAMVFAVAPP